MVNRAGVECGQAEVRRAVHEAPILRTQRDVSQNREIGAAAVCEHTGGLTLRAWNRSECVAGGIEDQRTSFCQHVRANPEPGRSWNTEHKAACCLVYIGLNSRESGRSKKLLRVAIIAVDRLGCEPAVEVISVDDEKATGVRAALSYAMT